MVRSRGCKCICTKMQRKEYRFSFISFLYISKKIIPFVYIHKTFVFNIMYVYSYIHTITQIPFRAHIRTHPFMIKMWIFIPETVVGTTAGRVIKISLARLSGRTSTYSDVLFLFFFLIRNDLPSSSDGGLINARVHCVTENHATARIRSRGWIQRTKGMRGGIFILGTPYILYDLYKYNI